MLNVITNIWNEKQLFRARRLFFLKQEKWGRNVYRAYADLNNYCL